MRYSICSWIFGNHSIDKVLQSVFNSGYKYIDIHALVDDYDWDEVQRLTEKYSLKISGLLCDSGWPEEEKDLANNNKENRLKAIEYFKRQIELVRKLNADYLVVVPSSVGKYHLLGENDDDWNWAVESVIELAKTAETNGVNLVLEPINRYESAILNNSDDLVRFLNEVDHPNVRGLLDTYHMNIEESNIREAFVKLKDKLEIVHFADNNRQGIGQGMLDFDPFISAMKEIEFNKTVVLECMAPGPNPFNADKDETSFEVISDYATSSLNILKKWFN